MNYAEKALCELEIDDGELLATKRKLCAEKQALQGQLAEVNAKCTTRLPHKDFHKLQSFRGQIVKQLADKEAEIGELNRQRAELQTVLKVRKVQAGMFVREEVKQLVEIRDRWHAFSMDAGNHKKAREMAWKVSQELRAFLQPHFSPNDCPPV